MIGFCKVLPSSMLGAAQDLLQLGMDSWRLCLLGDLQWVEALLRTVTYSVRLAGWLVNLGGRVLRGQCAVS